MAIDFQGIQFVFVKIEGGTANIDTSMTDKIFDATKPQGIYRCFKLDDGFKSKKLKFGYNTFQNFSSIEEKEIWDKVNRDTFLGFNSTLKQLIINASAYYGLKDPDLKTDGELTYSGQISWFNTIMETSKTSNSIITLKQVDGSDVYIKLNMPTAWTSSTASGAVIMKNPPASVVYKRKSVLNTPYFEKGITLWAKSPEDNTPIMVNNCILTNGKSKLSTDKRFYGDPAVKYAYQQSSAYCKKVVYFEDTSTSTYAPLLDVTTSYLVKNYTGVKSIEYTYTKELTDILASGESLSFAVTLQNRYIWGYDTSSIGIFPIPNSVKFLPSITMAESSELIVYKEIGHDAKLGMPADLISLDTRKPFVLSESNFVTNIAGVGTSDEPVLDTSYIFENIPDGFIILAFATNALGTRVYRFKKGEGLKYARVSPYHELIEVSGTTAFGTEAKFRNNSPVTALLSKDAVINSTGFTDLGDIRIYLNFQKSSVPIITIMRI